MKLTIQRFAALVSSGLVIWKIKTLSIYGRIRVTTSIGRHRIVQGFRFDIMNFFIDYSQQICYLFAVNVCGLLLCKLRFFSHSPLSYSLDIKFLWGPLFKRVQEKPLLSDSYPPDFFFSSFLTNFQGIIGLTGTLLFKSDKCWFVASKIFHRFP